MRRIYLFVLLTVLVGQGFAQSEELNLPEIRTYAIEIERELRTEEPVDELIADEISTLTRYRSALTRCVQSTKSLLDDRTSKIQSIEENLEQLGSNLKQDTELALEDSKDEQAQASKKLVDCQLLEQRVGELIQTLTAIQNRRLISQMQFREANGLETTLAILKQPQQTTKRIYDLAVGVISRVSDLREQFLQLLPILLIGLGAAIWFRSRLKLQIREYDDTVQKISIGEAFLRVSERYAIWILPLSATSAFLLFKEMDRDDFGNLTQLVLVLTGYALTLALISFLLAPREGYARILTLRRQIAVPMTRSLRTLVSLSTLGGIFYLFFRKQDIPAEIVDAARLLAITIFCLNALIFLLMLARAKVISQFSRVICYFIAALFAVALLSAWLGYRNFCIYILQGALGTSLAGFLLWLLGQFTREVFDGLDLGTRRWHQKVRKRLAVKDDEHIPGLIWFRLIAITAVWSVAVVILLRGWDLSVTGFVLLRRYFL